jgi:hypothetical protein
LKSHKHDSSKFFILFLHKHNLQKILKLIAGHWWLLPAILATLEAEIRRIMVQSQPVQIVLKTLSQKYLTQKKGLAEWLKLVVPA